eukprot:2648108-Rhodomonas_salina.2
MLHFSRPLLLAPSRAAPLPFHLAARENSRHARCGPGAQPATGRARGAAEGAAAGWHQRTGRLQSTGLTRNGALHRG